MSQVSKRVAIFSPQLSAVGTEGAMLGIARGLAKKGYAVDLVAAGTEWSGQQASDSATRRHRILPRWLIKMLPARGLAYRISLAVLHLLAIPLLALYLRRNRPDYLIVGLLPLAAIVAVSLARTETPVVISVQGLPRPSGMRNRSWRWMAKRAAGWVTPTESISRLLNDMAGRDVGAAVIMNPVLDAEQLGGPLPAR